MKGGKSKRRGGLIEKMEWEEGGKGNTGAQKK